MQRYQQLYALSLAKEISNLRVQVRYPLIIDGTRRVLTDSKKQVAHYTPDFVYEKAGHEIIEDVKSKGTKRDRTAMLRIRVFEAIYCKEVRIIII